MKRFDKRLQDFIKIGGGTMKKMLILFWGILFLFVINMQVIFAGEKKELIIGGMEFVWVPGGCYEMGDIFGDGWPCEKPVHEVCVDGFWIGKYEVTIKQFKEFVKETGYKTDAEREDGCLVKFKKFMWSKGKNKNWKDPGFLQTERNPVVCVSWNDAKAFANWFSKKVGMNCRLPTEAEWEYACRSRGKKVKYATSTGELNHELANYSYYIGKTTPVGKYPPNPLGLYDMTGNVDEWCEDVWDGEAYYKHDKWNPIIKKGNENLVFHVIRGGSWSNSIYCSTRGKYLSNERWAFSGFRLVCKPK